MKELFSTSFGKIDHIEEGNILICRFLGSINYDDYSAIWGKLIELTKEFKGKRFIMDQSKVGDVSFMARGKVIIKHLPAIKREVGDNFTVALLTSSNVVSKSGMVYMVKAFKKLISSFDTESFNEETEAIKWIITK